MSSYAPVQVVPFIYQTVVRPVVTFLQRRSGLLSPLRSTSPTMVQSGSLTTEEKSSYAPVQIPPFIYQAVIRPVTLFRQTISGLLSPLKSATPTMLQSGPTVG